MDVINIGAIKLIRLEVGHSTDLFKLTEKNRSYLREWLPWLDNIQEERDTAEFIITSIEQYTNNNGFQAGIWFEGELVGVIGLHYINWLNRSTEIGYWLDKDYQGKGIITQACSALIGYIFLALKLNRIEIRCATQNFKSRAIPERLGFKEEGICRDGEWLYDKFVDSVIYGLLVREAKF